MDNGMYASTVIGLAKAVITGLGLAMVLFPNGKRSASRKGMLHFHSHIH